MKTTNPYHPPAEVPTFTYLRESGSELFVTAKRFRGEAGSVSVPDCVEVLLVRDARGHEVELGEVEFAAIQREAEKVLL